MTKLTTWFLRPEKTHISQGIRPVWSESSVFAWRNTGSSATHWAHCKDWSDWADAQADLSLCWAHRSFCWFCHEAAHYLDRAKQIWYLSPMRAAKVQASLRIHAVSPEPSLLVHTSSESRGTFRQNTRSLVPLNGWTCAVEICHDGMLEDTNSLDRPIYCRNYAKNEIRATLLQ